jgi:arabinofuranosyltransferase
MFLPSLFGALMPVMVVAPTGRRWRAALALAVVPWAVLCAFALRAPVDGERFDRFPDQRRTQDLRAEQAGIPEQRRAVTLADHARLRWSQPDVGYMLRDMAGAGPAIVLGYRTATREVDGRELPVAVPRPVPGARPVGAARGRVVAYTGSIGRAGLAAGPRVHLVDRLGLADPLAARLRIPEPRRRKVGHEKSLPPEWVLARFTDPKLRVGGNRAWRARVAAARAAVACPSARELLAATSAPLTPGRFLANVRQAPRLHGLRFSEDVRMAVRDLCRGPA